MTLPEEKKPDSDQEKTPLRRLQFNVAKDATKAEMAEALTDQLMKQMFGEKEKDEEDVEGEAGEDKDHREEGKP
jgi:hypothetical protein